LVLRLDELWGCNPRPAASLAPYLYTSGKQPRATTCARVLGPTARSRLAQGGTLQFHVPHEIESKVAHRDGFVPASPSVPSSGHESHSAGRNMKKTVTCRAKSEGLPGMSPTKSGLRGRNVLPKSTHSPCLRRLDTMWQLPKAPPASGLKGVQYPRAFLASRISNPSWLWLV